MRALVAVAVLSSVVALASEPKRDPFEPPAGARTPPPSQCVTSLCQHELSELKLVAVVTTGPEGVAMFEDRRGTGLVARRHAEIGTHGGRVTRIDRGCVTVTELVPGADGRALPSSQRVCVQASSAAEVRDLLADQVVPVP